MNAEFVREGGLMDIGSYPLWAQDIVAENTSIKESLVRHPIFVAMRDGTLHDKVARPFLVGLWPTIEQFPQFMAMTLQKARYGYSRGEDMARRYLVRNIRVEQNHAEHWVNWSQAHDVSLKDLLMGRGAPSAAHALSHWSGHTSARDSLAVAMAATNYAIEGATGEISCFICADDTYENTFPSEIRAKAMKWLKLHSHYDDEHPWEALEIIATVLGTNPAVGQVAAVSQAVRKSYEYLKLTFDSCLD
jgi:pyrroloquinoline quinone (PQQ) biosynthesis protein C